MGLATSNGKDKEICYPNRIWYEKWSLLSKSAQSPETFLVPYIQFCRLLGLANPAFAAPLPDTVPETGGVRRRRRGWRKSRRGEEGERAMFSARGVAPAHGGSHRLPQSVRFWWNLAQLWNLPLFSPLPHSLPSGGCFFQWERQPKRRGSGLYRPRGPNLKEKWPMTAPKTTSRDQP